MKNKRKTTAEARVISNYRNANKHNFMIVCERGKNNVNNI